MNKEEYQYLISIFRCKESPGLNSPEFIQNIIYDKQLLKIYMRLTKQPIHSPVKEYADYELGLKIAESVQTTGQCEFTAEL